MDYLNLLQWPALVITVLAGWLTSSSKSHKRLLGFGLFLLSNVLWIAWGYKDEAYALIVLQVCLAVTNTHGVYKNRKQKKTAL
jgi:hypothetical protein